MKANVSMKVGLVDYSLEIDEREEMETLHKMIVLGNPRSKCNVCGDTGFTYKKFDTNKDKEGNTYINVVCLSKGCGAKSKLGLYKAGGYFWHEYKKWEGAKKSEDTSSEDVANDIPF